MKYKINIFILFVIMAVNIVRGQNNDITFEDCEIKQNSDCVQQVDTIDGMDVLSIAEKMPDFIGGYESLMRYLSENIKYPATTKNEGVICAPEKE